MPPADRHPKRQRKKEAAAARRQAMAEMAAKRRKQRLTLLSVTAVALIVGAVGIVMAVQGREPAKPAASPKPTPEPAPSPGAIACDGKYPDAAGVTKPTFAKADDQKLNKAKTYLLRLDTSCGQIDIKLNVAKSPKTANSVAFLARKGFYDGLTFHRVSKDFVIQGGDPKGDGTGGSGYKVTEAPAKGTKYTKGMVAMAKAGSEAPGTSGSQFFVVSGDKNPTLPAEYAVLGEVTSGMDAVDQINGLGGPDGPPAKRVYIKKASIVEG